MSVIMREMDFDDFLAPEGSVPPRQTKGGLPWSKLVGAISRTDPGGPLQVTGGLLRQPTGLHAGSGLWVDLPELAGRPFTVHARFYVEQTHVNGTDDVRRSMMVLAGSDSYQGAVGPEFYPRRFTYDNGIRRGNNLAQTFLRTASQTPQGMFILPPERASEANAFNVVRAGAFQTGMHTLSLSISADRRTATYSYIDALGEVTLDGEGPHPLSNEDRASLVLYPNRVGIFIDGARAHPTQFHGVDHWWVESRSELLMELRGSRQFFDRV